MNPHYPLFVYGSLKKGFPLHYALDKANFVGPASMKNFKMYSLGAFPCIVRDDKGGGTITGEIYLVGPDTLVRLDWIEGGYKRDLYPTTDGRWVGVYVWKGHVPKDALAVEDGIWKGDEDDAEEVV